MNENKDSAYNLDLFPVDSAPRETTVSRLSNHSVILKNFATAAASKIYTATEAISAQAPFRHWQTPGGKQMSALSTNCGELGWVSDRKGYRYQARDPQTEQPWPALPQLLAELAHDAAAQAGYADFTPDSCLLNKYLPKASMGLHQDRDERDFSQPIVSISLGLPAQFLWGGLKRSDRPQRLLLEHGDIVVWGAADRLRYHGIAPVKVSTSTPADHRLNLTLRKAG
ncbi:MAG: DNA oxidative demethylase AlkB [Idiomarina sp.]